MNFFTKITTRVGLLVLMVVGSAGAEVGEEPAQIQFFGDFFLPKGSKLRRYRDANTYIELSRRAYYNVANLEGAISHPYMGPVFKRYQLEMGGGALAALEKLNIKTVTLANNHTMDFGVFGLVSTLDALEEAQISYQGAGFNITSAAAPLILELPTTNLCILSYSRTYPDEHWAHIRHPGVASLSFTRTAAAIKRCSKVHKHTAAIFHWGEEGHPHFKPYQQKLARLAIDSGASFVIGHHPHVVQEVEIYKGKPIFYSLGNFIFGRASREDTFQGGAAAQLYFDDKGSLSAFAFELLPITEASELVRILDGLDRSICKIKEGNKRLVCSLKDS